MTTRLPPIPRIICHRGARGYAPENTIAAMRKAAEMGGRWVEFDAKLSRDGHVILLHDDDVKRTTNGKGTAAGMDLAALRRLDAGGWFDPAFAGESIPTLSATIEALAELGLGANVEIKPCPDREAETGRIVCELLLGEWPASLPAPLISSFSETALAAAQETAPDLARALLLSRVPADWLDRARRYGCVAIHVDHKRLDAGLVADMHGAGLAARAYTVNERERAEALFGWGVDGVFTDFFDRLSDM